ncbi:MAG: chemotaxis-specific protein-glutamate methyltransferase CheB [Spirochaetes bacterium]|jgi:two-component system chemotaxis response regulator CheB|nr:chemotaxis-specific protein-glutamate methyltransferase CheB [Spirochaetota bacterium]
MPQPPEKIRALVVDDSALMRNLVSKMLEAAGDVRVVGTAMNGEFALQKIGRLEPDVVVLDIEMPVMGGIEFLQERRKRSIDVPVVVLSSVAKKGARVTMDALALGAADFVTKPSGSVSRDIVRVEAQVVELVRAYGRQHRHRKGLSTVDRPQGTAPPTVEPHARPSVGAGAPTAKARPEAEAKSAQPAAPQPPERPGRVTPLAEPGRPEVVAIGISTGGPNALRKVFAELDEDLSVPVLVVQHMPAGFTTEFARSLDRVCALTVREAEDGMAVRPGNVLIAPGNYHLGVVRNSSEITLRVTQDDTRNGHRPSADVLFETVAELYGNHAVGVIMTGMGRDGSAGLAKLYERGGMTIGQDEASSVVYGMPKVAYELGYVRKQVALHEIARAISDAARATHV